MGFDTGVPFGMRGGNEDWSAVRGGPADQAIRLAEGNREPWVKFDVNWAAKNAKKKMKELVPYLGLWVGWKES